MIQSERPNVLFVLVDQLSACWTGCYGNQDVATPHLDAFAETATRFERAYTASPVCTPYRGTLFTGRYPTQTGITDNQRRIPNCETTLADLFNRGGYHTCLVGKWHLAGAPGGSRWVSPEDRGGFQDFVGWESWHWQHWNNTIFDGESQEPVVMPGHDTDGITNFAVERLQRYARAERAFCMFVSHQAPHAACKAPERYRQMYRGREFRWRENSRPETRFTQYQCDCQGQEFLEEYLSEVTHLDDAFKRLLDDLEKFGLTENTIVIFTSDHGEMASSHGLYEKRVMYDESVRVPLLVHLPGQRDGQVSPAPVSSVDFLPTLLELCGLEPGTTAEGVSFAAQLKDADVPPLRESVFSQLRDRAAILEGPYTLELSPDGNEVCQLLDIEADPWQLQDFKENDDYRVIRDDMKARFQEWLDDIQTRIGQPELAARPRGGPSDEAT